MWWKDEEELGCRRDSQICKPSPPSWDQSPCGGASQDGAILSVKEPFRPSPGSVFGDSRTLGLIVCVWWWWGTFFFCTVISKGLK